MRPFSGEKALQGLRRSPYDVPFWHSETFVVYYSTKANDEKDFKKFLTLTWKLKRLCVLFYADNLFQTPDFYEFNHSFFKKIFFKNFLRRILFLKAGRLWSVNISEG